MKTTTSAIGREAQDLIDAGLEVGAEIALEEPQCPQGVDKDVLRAVRKHGLKGVLDSLAAAAWGAAEMHEGGEDMEVVALRLRIFGKRIERAIGALK